MNRNTAAWLVLLATWTFANAAEQNTDAETLEVAEALEEMTDAEVTEALEEIKELFGVHPQADSFAPSAYCTSYTDNGKRRIYLTRVFNVDLAGWRNVKEDRPSTEREVMTHFEFEYVAWLEPRYEGVWVHKTHCRLFSLAATAGARRMQDIEDFRELGHRVVETDWMP